MIPLLCRGKLCFTAGNLSETFFDEIKSQKHRKTPKNDKLCTEYNKLTISPIVNKCVIYVSEKMLETFAKILYFL